MVAETRASAGWIELFVWAEKNRKQLMIGIAAAALIGAGLATVAWRKNVAELEASGALLKLQTPDDPSSAPKDTPSSAYLKIVQDYAGTDAARRALILAAGALFSEGKYSEAATRFEQFLKEAGDHSMAPAAAFGLAASLESQGKPDEAAKAYQEIITRYPKAAVFDDAKLALARLHESKGEPALALKIYDELTAPNPTGIINSQAQTRKQQLLAKHPELLVVTNTAPAISTNAPVGLMTNLPTAAPAQPSAPVQTAPPPAADGASQPANPEPATSPPPKP